MYRILMLAAIVVVSALLSCGCRRSSDSDWVPKPEAGEKLRGVPDWYLCNYNSRDTLYARGTYEAVDMTMAHTKATNQAYEAIERVHDYTREQLQTLPYGTVDERFIFIKNGGHIRAYVLLRIPYDDLPWVSR